jgi:PAS domain S-box-containing protein
MLVVLTLCVVSLEAQPLHSDTIDFQKIPTPGVSNSLMEDRDGFIWFGTDVGLWRYDGYGFKNYSHIVPERIDTTMYQDRDGMVWIGTENGLVAFNPATETSVKFRHDPGDTRTLSNSVFQYKKQAFCEDAKGRLWIATDEGLNLYDKINGTFISCTRINAGLIDNYITAILPSADGLLWIATIRGLQKFDPEKRAVVQYYPGAPLNMYAMVEDAQGRLWIGAYLDGLHRLDPETSAFTPYRKIPGIKDSLSGKIITFLLIPRDNPDSIWIATFDGGLNILDTKTGRIRHFIDTSESRDEASLSGNSLSHIIQDRMGALLVLNEHGYLNRVDPGTRRFTTLSCNATGIAAVPKASAYSVWADRTGAIWIVAGNKKVSRYDSSQGRFGRVVDLSGGTTGIVATDKDGTVWMSGDGAITRFDPATGRMSSRIPVEGLRLNGVADKTDPDLLWLASANVGLVKVDKKNRKVQYIIPENTSEESDDVNKMVMRLILAQDDDGSIWLSTFGVGLQKFDPRTGQIIGSYAPVDVQLGNPAGFMRDSRGRCWVSFQNGGPALFDVETGIFTRFETLSQAKWPARGSTSMLEDSRGRLWISGNGSGEIVRFDPETNSLRLYTQADGVAPGTSDTLNRPPVIGPDGDFWFSGMGGVTRFFPERIKDNPYIPPVHIVELVQDGTPLAKHKAIGEPLDIILPPDKNYFDFEAVALNYRLSPKNQYRYRLIGRDEKWFDAGNRNSGHYSGLGEGMYILEVEGSNNDGVWNPRPASLNIYVQPEIPKDVRVFTLDEIREGKTIHLTGDRNSFMFEAVPLDFSIVKQRGYEYHLEGYDPDWIPVTSRRFIAYQKLPPGRYTFRIRNVKTNEPLAMTVRIHPPFYRSWWFLTLVALLVSGMAGAFYLQRYAYLEHERQEFGRHRVQEQALVEEKLEAVEARLAAIAARENAVEALQSSERRNRDLLDTMTEGFIIIDADGLLSYANHRFCEMLGYTALDIHKKPLDHFVDEFSLHVIRENLAVLRQGRAATFESRWLRSDGKPLTALVSARAIIDGSGFLREAFAVITDISMLKATEEMLRAGEQELMRDKSSLEEVNTTLKVLLEKREEDIEEVKAGLQHSLKNHVLPYLGKLIESGLDERQVLLAKVIEDNISGMSSEMALDLGDKHAGLTHSEAQVLDLIKDGKITKEIAAVLGISVRTVEFHRSNIRKKLGMKGKKGDLRSHRMS